MNTPELDNRLLRTLLEALGAHLQAEGTTFSVIAVGGAALSLHGWVERTTHDVDIIATVSEGPAEE